MPGGSKTHFNGDAAPRARVIPVKQLVDRLDPGRNKARDDAYQFSNRRKFPEPLVPGIYDPGTDDLG